MSNLETSICVGSVFAACFFIGCILGEALFRVLRDRREAEYDRRQAEHDRTCRECCGDGDLPCCERAYRCVECDRELGGE